MGQELGKASKIRDRKKGGVGGLIWDEGQKGSSSKEGQQRYGAGCRVCKIMGTGRSSKIWDRKEG